MSFSGISSAQFAKVVSLSSGKKALYVLRFTVTQFEKICFCVLSNLRALNMNMLTEFVEQKRLEGKSK